MEIYDFGLRLKKLRKSKNLTQNQVAEKLKVERSSISVYERNISAPNPDTLGKLAVLYNVSADYLLGISNRKSLILDELTESQQEAVFRAVDEIKKEFIKANDS